MCTLHSSANRTKTKDVIPIHYSFVKELENADPAMLPVTCSILVLKVQDKYMLVLKYRIIMSVFFFFVSLFFFFLGGSRGLVYLVIVSF